MKNLKLIVWIVTSLMFLACGCSKKSGTSNSGSTLITLTGTAALPAPFAVYEVFDSAQIYTAVARFSCPAQGNASLIKGPTIVLQTMKNCSDSQWIYFSLTDPVDLSAYASGSIEIRLQATGGSMSINAKLQDNATKVSNSVDLATVGFDNSKMGVEQKVVIPVSSFGSGSVDLTKLTRLLHLDVSCASTDCYLSIFSVRWLGPLKPVTSLASTSKQNCDPFACHTLSRATYRFYKPTQNGWTATPATSGVTNTDGTYQVLLTRSQIETLWNGAKPLILAMAENGGVYTFNVTLTADDLAASSLELDTSIASTIATQLVCPGGLYPAPSGSYCNAPTKAQRNALQDAIAAYLVTNPPSSVDLEAIAEGAIADANVAASLKAIIADPSVTPSAQIIKTNEGTYPLPPPNDGLGTGTALPSNLPAGSYLFSFQVCGAGTCQDGSQTVNVTSTAASTIAAQITSIFNQTSMDCTAAGVTCQDRYSAFNGYSFTVSRFITACANDVCTTASVSIKLTLK